MAKSIKKKKSRKISVVKKSRPSTKVKVGIKTFKSDSHQSATLVKAGRTGATRAIKDSKAMGLTITFMEDGILYKEMPDGTKKIIVSKKKKNSYKKSGSLLKKGTILHAKGK